MAKITSIKQQQKRTDRYSIYVDGRYAFSLSEAELIKSGVHGGQELTESDLGALKDSSVADKAYSRALDMLSRRPRSEWELRDYLKRKKYDPEVIDKILSRLSDIGYVNDQEFARLWVDNRRLLKATSKRRLRQELQHKRIKTEIIDAVLDADETDEREVIREVIQRKRKQAKYQDDLKLMQYLSRQGYSYEDIRSVLSED